MRPSSNMVMQTRMVETLGVRGGDNNSQEVATPLITPNTLKSITQIFESQDCLKDLQCMEQGEDTILQLPAKEEKPSSKTYHNLDSKAWMGGTTTVVTPTGDKCIPNLGLLISGTEDEENNMIKAVEENVNTSGRRIMKRTSSMRTRSSIRANNASQAPPTKKAAPSPPKKSGRKPAKRRPSDGEDEDMDPDDARRVMVRRQRNKEAAARCRKRRVDLTNTLMSQVEDQEAAKRELERQIQELRAQKDELEFILQAHVVHCRLDMQQQQPENLVVAVKSEPVLVEPANAPFVLVTPQEEALLMEQQREADLIKPKRPATLSLGSSSGAAVAVVSLDTTGITIDTPSSLFPALSFDNVTTGLTPCAPTLPAISTPMEGLLNTPVTCSGQIRDGEFVSL